MQSKRTKCSKLQTNELLTYETLGLHVAAIDITLRHTSIIVTAYKDEVIAGIMCSLYNRNYKENKMKSTSTHAHTNLFSHLQAEVK